MSDLSGCGVLHSPPSGFGSFSLMRFGSVLSLMRFGSVILKRFGSDIALGSVRNMVSMLLFLPLQSSLFLPIPRYAPPIRPGLPCCLFTSCSRKYHAPVRFRHVRSDPYPIRSPTRSDPDLCSISCNFSSECLRHTTASSTNLTILINHKTYHRVIAT